MGKRFVVGLTGGIASGKTAVSDQLAALGADIVDTDLIAREVVAPGSEGLLAVATRFGAGVLTAEGSLDRAALRRHVFADPGARRELEAILHPRIRALSLARVREGSGPYVVLVVPLLVESGAYGFVNRVLVVDVPETVQMERLRRRDGSDEASARSMLAAQVDRGTRLAEADDVIRNTGTLDALLAQSQQADRRYRQLGGQKALIAAMPSPHAA
jgi:dephospho-CoA kinase